MGQQQQPMFGHKMAVIDLNAKTISQRFMARAFLSVLKNDKARSWISQNPIWSASKTGNKKLFCSTCNSFSDVPSVFGKKQHRLLLLAAKDVESVKSIVMPVHGLLNLEDGTLSLSRHVKACRDGSVGLISREIFKIHQSIELSKAVTIV
jgi:hypothetical protein